MSGFDFFKLILLSAIWGGSFLFARVAVPEFGPFALIWMRVSIAALILCPVLMRKRVRRELMANAGKMLLIGIFNAVLPWCLLAYALLTLEAGFTSLLNAATPMFAAVLGFLWLRLPLTRWQVLGLIVGMGGVAILAANRFTFGNGGSGIAILAVLGATISYGFVSHYIKRYMSDLSTWSVTIGNLLGATLVLTPLAIFHIPEVLPGSAALWSAAGLGILSTAVAFILLYDILSRSGATATTTVTFIIPIFGVLFGVVFLKEEITLRMVLGMVVALFGAALATGLIPRRITLASQSTN